MSTPIDVRAIIDSAKEVWVKTALVKPNKWNFNVQTDEQMASLRYSRDRYGEIYPVLVRELEDGTYEVVDGEHRWRTSVVAKEKELRVKNFGKISDDLAKELMLVLNETRGNPDQVLLAELVMKLKSENKELVLPYSEKYLDELRRLSSEGAERVAAELKKDIFRLMGQTTELCVMGAHEFEKIKVMRCKKCKLVELSKI